MDLTFTPLTIQDRLRFDRAISAMSPCRQSPLAHWAFAPHFIWQHCFVYRWTELNGWLCLFAEYADGLYMPLPPVGRWAEDHSHARESWNMTVQAVMHYMRHRNSGSSVTRIDNLPEALKPQVEEMGYRVVPKGPDYLYRTSDLAALRGDSWKSQRAACNRLVRTHRVRYEPYRREHRKDCLALLQRWVDQKVQAANTDAYASALLHDAIGAHQLVLDHAQALGLVGRVVWVDGALGGYTFGFERSPDVLCVLLEIADRATTGVAQFLFREWCREFQRYPLINTLDDAGLDGLARSKRAYRPCQLVANYTVVEP